MKISAQPPLRRLSAAPLNQRSPLPIDRRVSSRRAPARHAPSPLQACAEPESTGPRSEAVWAFDARFMPLHAAAAFGGEALRHQLVSLPRELWGKAAAYISAHCDARARYALLQACRSDAGHKAIVEGLMQDSDPLVRHALVRLATKSQLRTLATDTSPWVRSNAQRALAADLGETSTLSAALEQEPHAGVRRSLVEALKGSDSPLLPQLVRDPEPWIAAAAMQALPHSTASEAALREQCHAARPDWLRYVALRELAKRSPLRAGRTLLEITGSVAQPLHTAMVRMLVRLAPGVVPAFAGLMGWAERDSVELQLQMLDTLVSPVASHADQRAAAYDLRMLASRHGLGDPDLAQALVDALTSCHTLATEGANPDINWFAKIYPAPLWRCIDSWRTSANPQVLTQAAQLLERWPEPDAAAMLRSMVHSPMAPSYEIIQALSGRPDGTTEGVIAALEDMALHHDPRARARTSSILERLGSNRADSTLSVALRDPDAEVRQAAVWPAVRRGTPALLHLVTQLVGDPDPHVRLLLAHACETFATDVALPLLKQLIGQRSEIRRRAISSLAKHLSVEAIVMLDDASTMPMSREEAVYLDEVRSRSMLPILGKHGVDPTVTAILQRWARRAIAVDSIALSRLARTSDPTARVLLNIYADSPHEGVRKSAQAAVRDLLKASWRAST